MKLGEVEKAMLAGDRGEVRRAAIAQQIEVGRFFGADDFVPVAQAHIMADTESLGEAGVATAWMLHEMTSRDMAPAALLLNTANPIIAQGAAFAGLHLIDRFEVDITQAIKTGDVVHVDPASGTVTVRR